MPGPSNTVGQDFASIISSAATPPTVGNGEGRDLPDGFPRVDNPLHRVVDTANEPEAIPGMVAYDFKIHRKVFLIYRPWESCDRCQNDIASGLVVLPPIGDYDCPHNNEQQYAEIMNEILAGKLVMGSEQEIVNKDGSVSVSVRWYERKIDHKKRRQYQKEQMRMMRQQEEPDV